MLKGIPRIISPELLSAIMELFPLDPYADKTMILMEVTPGG